MPGVPSGEARRRNGKTASCEPCRKSKIRCDHGKPICARCQRRALQSECYYHPAPLTKSIRSQKENVTPGGQIPTPLSPTGTHHPPQDPTQTTGSNTNTPALAHILESETRIDSRWVDRPIPLNQNGTRSGPRRFAYSSANSHHEHVGMVVDILRHLRHLSDMNRLCRSYYFLAQASLAPPGLILPALASMSSIVERYQLFEGSEDERALSTLAESVLRSTSIKIPIHANLTPTEFLEMHTGDNLRLEYIGLIYCIAARSCVSKIAQELESYDDFIRNLYHCSITCLRLARDLSPVNDAMSWLGQNELILTTAIEGDSSEIVWRKLADFNSDLLALGVHRESFNATDTPMFIAECRRRVFTKAYHHDKFMATLFDRPPGLLQRYSDCKMPLDLSDDEVIAEPEKLEAACRRLTEDGWNTEEKFFPATWTRVRYMTAGLREQILEGEFYVMTADRIAELKQLSERNRQAWESLPSHLRYSPSCWTAGYSASVCGMLVVVLLGYLQTDFHIFRLLERSDPTWNISVVKIAAEMVALIIEFGNWRRKATFMNHDFSYVILSYGLPAAAVLTTAAHSLSRHGNENTTLPPELSRTQLIRYLIVFVSQLESIHGPEEANYEICVQASKAISRTIDGVLDESLGASSQAPLTLDQPEMLDSSHAGVVAFDALNTEGWENFDLSNWIKTLDWTGTGGGWSTF